MMKTAACALRLLALGLAVAGPLGLGNLPARANPKGGQVVAGSAGIDPVSQTRLDINQSTNRAIIDWQSFDIAPSQWTAFQQPGAGAVTLNRVTAGDPSVIAGRLTANGSLVLLNPSGVTFAKGAQVNVNSLIATPTGISNANFMAGRMRFDRPSADPRARVVNRGRVTVAEHGLAALVAPGVANSGLIRAKLGRVVVAGAKTYTVDLYGDGLISFDVGSKVTEVPVGRDGRPVRSLVSNTGHIETPGGSVLLTADAVGGILRNVVENPGTIDARTAGAATGSVTIDAGPGGAASLSGRIDVSGTKPGEKGGTATVTGRRVSLTGTARIDANGYAGGGRVRIGGGPHGNARNIRDAMRTTVAKGAAIAASAIGAGRGGRVTVWSERGTRFAGAIRVRGGRLDGDGGVIETSGRTGLAIAPSAAIDAAAWHGKAGQWLLDPGNLTVTNTGHNISENGGTFAPTGNNARVSAALINRILGDGTNVTLTTVGAPGTQNGNITVAANGAITWNTAASLTLDAAGNIATRGAVTATNIGAFIDLAATGNIVIRSPVGTPFLTLNATGNIVIAGPITAAGGADPTVGLTAGGGISEPFGGLIFANTLDVTSVGAVSLAQANSVARLAFDVSGAGSGFLYRNSGQNLTIGFGDGTHVGTNGGAITAAVTGTGEGGDGFDLTVPGGETVRSKGGNITFSASGANSGFSNAGVVRSHAAGGAGDIVILADTMNLAGGTLDAGTATVLLGPATATNPIALVALVPGSQQARILDLTAGDLASITAGMLQIGYRNKDGTPSLTGDISIDAPLAIHTGRIGSLLLVTGGAVTEAAGASLRAVKGAPPLTLGIIAGGPVTLGGANAVGTLAGFVDGTGNGFFFQNAGADLTIGALPRQTLGVAFDANDIASASVMRGPASNPLAGLTTNGGNVLLETTASGNLTLAAAVDAGTGAVGLASAGSLTQDPGPITAASLAIVAADRVSLGAFGGPADPNKVGTLAAEVLNVGESFVFRNDAANLTIGTVNLSTAFGRHFRNPLTGAVLTGTLSGVTTNNANLGLRATTSGDLVLEQNVDAGTAGVGLEAAGTITQTGGVVTGGTLAIAAGGSVSLPDANKVAILAGETTGAGNGFLFRDAAHDLTIGTVSALLESGTGTPPNDRMLSVGALAGVTTAGGNLLLETTTSGNLLLAAAVDAGTGAVGLASAGSLTQDPGPITAASLAIVAADRVSLGAFGGPADPNKVGTLAAEVLNAGESFVFGNDALTLTIGTVDLGTAFGRQFRNPLSGKILETLAGVTTNNANIGLRVTTSGNLVLDKSVDAGAAGVGLEAAGTITQTSGVVTGGTLAILAGGAVSLPDANKVGVLAGDVTGAGNGFAFRDAAHDLTIGTVPALLESGTGTPPNDQILSVGSLSGVTTNGGNVLIETTASGNLDLSAAVDAGTGVVGLASAGSLTQDPGPITASSLAIVAADRVSLGAFGGPADPNKVGTLAAEVLNAGESFVFGNDAQSLTIGTVDLRAAFGSRFVNPVTLQALPASLSGVVTENANIGLRVTTSGDLLLTANVDAGTAAAGFEAAGAILQTAGTVTADELAISAGGPASLPAANKVAVLAGRVTGGGGSFLFRDDALDLTIGTVPALLESGTGTPPNDQMLSVGSLSGVTTAGGDVGLRTTTAGDLTLGQNVGANGGSVALSAAGDALETGGIVAASSLGVEAGGSVFFGITETGGTAALGIPNEVGTVAGSAGGTFGLLNGRALTIGTVPTILGIAGQSGIAATGDALVEVDGAGQGLNLAAGLTAGARGILAADGGFAQTGSVSVAAPVLVVDTTGEGVAALLGVVSGPDIGAGTIAGLPSTGAGGPMQFAGLSTPGTVLLVAGNGAVAGTMTVGGLGVSGTGSFADLFGSIAGVTGPTAASLGTRNPGPEAAYLFNDCVIAAATCTSQPTGFLTVPSQPPVALTALIPLPNLAAVIEFVTPEEVQGRQPANPEEPVINIFDEERLCAQTTNPSLPSKERCPERQRH